MKETIYNIVSHLQGYGEGSLSFVPMVKTTGYDVSRRWRYDCVSPSVPKVKTIDYDVSRRWRYDCVSPFVPMIETIGYDVSRRWRYDYASSLAPMVETIGYDVSRRWRYDCVSHLVPKVETIGYDVSRRWHYAGGEKARVKNFSSKPCESCKRAARRRYIIAYSFNRRKRLKQNNIVALQGRQTLNNKFVQHNIIYD